MPTIISHALVPLAVGWALGERHFPRKVIFAGAALAMLPDLDVIGFKLGIAYADDWGHRGASHALLIALILSWLVTMALKPERWGRAGLFLFAAMASHGLLDALTSGGLGPALFWPFDTDRHFAPWTPIRVSPIGAGFFSWRGMETMISELQWIWFPLLLLAAFIRFTFNQKMYR